VLANYYLCSSWVPVASVTQIVERLKSGPPVNPAGG